ncbi:MAG: Rieske 2Fe-2S domain-containing protein [Verrucomicrobiales bacterium]|nr:Rieske 2Fe-2S domain-containing protein [Verrucomicrobiales bacterium]
MEDEFQYIAKVDEIEEGKGRPFVMGEHRIALVRHEGVLYGVDDVCPHADASLAFGPVKDGCIICPWHYAEFKLETGEAMSGPVARGIRTYEVKEVDGDIFIKLKKPEATD